MRLMGLAAFCVVLVGAAMARDIVPAETRLKPWDGMIPACESQSVLSDISSRFAATESGYWSSTLAISGFSNIALVADRPSGADYIPRRFCQADVLTNDNMLRKVYYSIREDLGTIGATWDVLWCVTGTDRQKAFEPDCRMAQP